MGIDELRSGFAEPPPSAAPCMRRWWFGPAVTRLELERELTAIADAGLAGVEVAYVYPLGRATAEFGSDAFLADLRFAAERAHELGLRFDLTLGSGWSFGGPHISPELAARQLHWERREIRPGPLEIPVVSPWPGDDLVAAYVGAGSLQEQPASYEQLPFVDGRLMIEDGTGPRVMLLAYARLTGQNVKRAAAGAEGPVLDHYSATATEAHLKAVGDRMLDAVPAELVGSVFCDSLEVYDADWTQRLPAEFARRRGYDVLPMLYRLTVDGPEAARLRADYHRTLLGINQLFGHGWPYSPPDAPGLGWFFYAAGALDDRNPWWPAMPQLTRYLSRLCWLLQQGEPVADVALYLPNENLFATMSLAQGGSLNTWREANRRIPLAIPATIRNAGLDYDLIDDDALKVTPPGRYRVIIIPTPTTIPQETTVWLDRVRASGGTVLAVDSTVHLPGALEVEAEGLADALAAAVVSDLRISPPTPDIGFVHRRCADAEVYWIANTGPATRTFSVVARTSMGSHEQWDAMSGRVLRAGAAAEGIELTLHPYEASVVVLSDAPVKTVSADARGERRLPLTGRWQVAHGNETARPVELPHAWEDEPGRQHYSGAASYRITIDLGSIDLGSIDHGPVDGRVLIDFGDCDVLDEGCDEGGLDGSSYRVEVRGPVGEVAQVRVNGIGCGLAWAPPYRVEITAALRSGSNEIEIIVYNTAANALTADEHIKRLAAESEARYGRRFRMQDLDQAMATVRSGLLQVPTLVLDVP